MDLVQSVGLQKIVFPDNAMTFPGEGMENPTPAWAIIWSPLQYIDNGRLLQSVTHDLLGILQVDSSVLSLWLSYGKAKTNRSNCLLVE